MIALLIVIKALNASLASGSTPPLRQRIEKRFKIARPKADSERYVYIPFEVPANAVRLNIEIIYDRAGGANALDLGLFDARSTGEAVDQKGFRGWSGGRRSSISIARESATPGYLPGPLFAGTWRVILGLYRLAPNGVEVTLRIEIEKEKEEQSSIISRHALRSENSPTYSAVAMSVARAPRRTSFPPSSSSRSAKERDSPIGGWLRGDLHLHTVHSDGDLTVAELVERARAARLDFIAITDHNTPSHHAEIDALLAQGKISPLIIRGEEVTTYGGHFNVWGLSSGEWVDFRLTPRDPAKLSRTIRHARSLGAIASINHPFAPCDGCAWEYAESEKLFDAIEVWNRAWDDSDERALKLWDEILRRGGRIAAVGSSDAHRVTDRLGQPSTYVRARTRSEGAILTAIRTGRAYVADLASDFRLAFSLRVAGAKKLYGIGDFVPLRAPQEIELSVKVASAPSGAIVKIISNGKVIEEFAPDGRERIFKLRSENAYYRLELRDHEGRMLAFTNPIYVGSKERTR
jgi:predicted metal-dependent phosphoesterase TrpH